MCNISNAVIPDNSNWKIGEAHFSETIPDFYEIYNFQKITNFFNSIKATYANSVELNYYLYADASSTPGFTYFSKNYNDIERIHDEILKTAKSLIQPQHYSKCIIFISREGFPFKNNKIYQCGIMFFKDFYEYNNYLNDFLEIKPEDITPVKDLK